MAVEDAVYPVVSVGSKGIAKIQKGLSWGPIECIDTLLDAIHKGAGLDCVQGSVAMEQGDVIDIIIETVLDAVVVSHFERKRCVEPRCESAV